MTRSQLSRMLETTDGKTVSFPVAYQYMMWMNMRTPACRILGYFAPSTWPSAVRTW